jgi:WD repeat-containing protein mio
MKYFDYIISEECIDNADLHGVLLTGLSSKCIDLFQSFIDRTLDVQTVALAVIHTHCSHVHKSEQVKYWIDSYRDLLNRNRLWEKRSIIFLKSKAKFHQK